MREKFKQTAQPGPAEFDIQTVRHSTAHLMAAAVEKLYPGTLFGVGPALDNGFYYDVKPPQPLTNEDLKKIEKTMRHMQKQRIPFEVAEVPVDDAIELMKQKGQIYKVELLQSLKEKGSTAVSKEVGDDLAMDRKGGVEVVTLYKLGNFIDLCRGPHVDHTGQTGEFSFNSIAGAYWRGDANRDQLQRVYALAYPTQEEVTAEVKRLEEVKRRDHRVLGKKLKIFTFSDEVGPGLPLWLPNGTTLRDELEYLAREEERRDGYKRVDTPVLTKEQLYERSGHLAHYKEDMYSPMDIEGQNYYLRPMNCPHHHEIFAADKHSYRDLPVRLSEFGEVYRYESSGSLSGIMRTRGFAQNDAHIYCREDQAKDEFVRVMKLHERYYRGFGIENFYMRLSLPDMNNLDKYVEKPDQWKKATAIIKDAMDESRLPYVEVPGEAAFYGPKIDFMIKSAVGTEYAISTSQLDFLATETFDLGYTGKDGKKEPVYVIHRAPLGSLERFVAFLLEHYGGKFPTWLAPVQATVIPIADRHHDYADLVKDTLLAPRIHNANGGLRVEVDLGDERMQKKIRNAQGMQIPYMLVVGDQEMESGTVSVRHRSGEDLGNMGLDQITDLLKAETETRTNNDLDGLEIIKQEQPIQTRRYHSFGEFEPR